MGGFFVVRCGKISRTNRQHCPKQLRQSWQTGKSNAGGDRQDHTVCSEAKGGKEVGDALIDLRLGATGRGSGLDAQAHFVAQIGQIEVFEGAGFRS